MFNHSKHFKLYILLFIAMLTWGLSWTNGKILGNYENIKLIIFWRFLLASIFFYPILKLTKYPIKPNIKSIPFIIINAIFIILYNIFYFYGTKFGFAGAGGVLVTTLNPILTTIISGILFKTYISFKNCLGLVLGLTGGLLIINGWKFDLNQIFLSGNLYFLLASCSWVLVTINTSIAKDKIHFMTYSFWSFLLGLLFCLPFIIHENILLVFDYDYIFWLNLILISVGAMAFGQSIYFKATTILGPKDSSSFIFLVPISALLFAIIFLNEPIILSTIFGGILGLSGVYLINKN